LPPVAFASLWLTSSWLFPEGFPVAATYHLVMDEKDARLTSVLRQWRELEPSTNFEANVWRRIRIAAAGEPKGAGLAELLHRLLWRPSMAVAVAVVASAMIGTTTGFYTTSPSMQVSPKELGFLSQGTLAGGYAKVLSRGLR
jgi:hypothetical protein